MDKYWEWLQCRCRLDVTGFEELTIKSGLYSRGRESQLCNKEIEVENDGGKGPEKARRLKEQSQQR